MTCNLRNQCTQRQQGKLIDRASHQAYLDFNDRRVHRNPEVYKLRQQIVEHIFGTWKRQWDLDQTILKGKRHVLTEYNLAAILLQSYKSSVCQRFEVGENDAEKARF